MNKEPQFKLRPWSMDDLPSLVKYANNPNIASNLSDGFPHPFTEADGKRFLEHFQEEDSGTVLCIEVDGEAAGSIGIHPRSGMYRKHVAIGYWLAEPFWGRGIISQAIPQIVDLAFEKYDINKVFACPYGKNKASHRVLEKCGFELEATLKDNIFKNSELDDELLYVVFRNEWMKSR